MILSLSLSLCVCVCACVRACARARSSRRDEWQGEEVLSFENNVQTNSTTYAEGIGPAPPAIEGPRLEADRSPPSSIEVRTPLNDV
jgi:hypothetical protein